ncbi:FprA family A-type flavoprotein [Clostridium sp. LIBA-8841]|uniref:FprA family A-type flavoprotein n=1 Tax=Clostridium sp. LIBA-8841 TaxID=2987530 RepID=UPI002AC5E9EC|nr:FprA family A-type flavoprotein [Clostridium sp. LIBA-8841]MDZ5254621.1 FprA family A-type flavoprotein [Clostridium sp. LIBA-8841]
MKHLNIKDDLFWVGALDPNLRVFDIIMYTPYGTTYNSYVVKGSEKTAVFETVKAEFFDQYISRLKDLGVEPSEIDYIVVSHTEPDHAGSIDKLLELAPNAKVVASPVAINYLKEIANRDFESMPVKDGDSISLGNKTLKFMSVPFLHWPDTIYTYVEEDKTLITCDSFGSHYSCEEMFDDLIPNEEEYMESLRYYFDCIMGPFKPYVLKALDKIKDLDIEIICPGHGPILRANPFKIVNLYKEWSTPAPANEIKKVSIFYVSAYGYTKQIAEEIIEGMKSTGNLEISLYNIIEHDMAELVGEVGSSDAILFGSPTIVNELLEPVRDLMSKLNPVVHGGKIAGAFGSYGWSGEAVPRIETRLKELKMKMPVEGLKIKFKPSEAESQEAFNFGVEIGNALK